MSEPGKLCLSCGTENPSGSAFCNSCGAALSRPEEDATTQPAQEPQPVPEAQQSQPSGISGVVAWWRRQSKKVKVILVVGVLVVIGAIVGGVQGGSGKTDSKVVAQTLTTARTTTTARPTTTLPPTTTTTESLADFMYGCEKIAYKALSKNPDGLVGNTYFFTGEIFQIREDAGTTFMLVSVTKERYFWDDNIAVMYAGTVDAYEDDIVNIWGICTGTYSYTSVAGWEISIPGIDARYVSKAK